MSNGTTTTTTQPFGGIGSGDAASGGGVDEDFYARVESLLDGTTDAVQLNFNN